MRARVSYNGVTWRVSQMQWSRGVAANLGAKFAGEQMVMRARREGESFALAGKRLLRDELRELGRERRK